MQSQEEPAGYNGRLFKSGLYGSHHLARFWWLEQKLKALGKPELSVLELGCYDARSLEHVPQRISRYVGFDAGWESGVRDGEAFGIEAARRRYASDGRFLFQVSTEPADLAAVSGPFDVGICLETFEHLPPDRVEDYLRAFARQLKGPLFATVPNEKGFALLAKTVGAKLLRVDRDMRFTPLEFANALLGRMERVRRKEHKGFDYAALAEVMRRYFGRVEIEGVGFHPLPPALNMTIGLVAWPRD